MSHTWTKKGNFSITARAKNVIGNEGGWTPPFVITVLAPDLDVGVIKGGFFRANVAIKNIGEAEATNVSWNLTVTGDTVFLGKESSGIIDSIPAGEEVKVQSNIIIGFGKAQFLVQSEEIYGSWDLRQQGGKLFLIYVLVNVGGK